MQDGDAPGTVVVGATAKPKWRFWVHAGLGVLEFVPLPWVSGPAGVVDAAGQLTGTMRHDGLIETRCYDDRHLPARVVDFGGGTTAFARDAFGRVVAVTDPLGQVTRLVYAERDGADFWTPSGLVRPDGVTVSREVEAGGARVATVDGEGRRTVRRYGPFGLLEAIETPGGGRLRFACDHRQRLAGEKSI